MDLQKVSEAQEVSPRVHMRGPSAREELLGGAVGLSFFSRRPQRPTHFPKLYNTLELLLRAILTPNQVALVMFGVS